MLLGTITSLLFYILLSLCVVPVLVYYCVKFGTYAFYKAKELAEKHNNTSN